MQKSRAVLSPDGLWKEVHNYFSSKSDILNGNKKKSASNIVDSLMAACAVFALKMPSLLRYDIDRRHDKVLFSNLKNLFHIDKPPSDTTMRERLDEIEPKMIRGIFKHLFAKLQRGKGLEQYEFLDKHYLILGDATGHFSSNQVYCSSCCETHHRSGEVTYSHKMLALAIAHPKMKRVIPLCPEPITKQDGESKNDCEQNASKRMLYDFRREHPHLKVVLAEDSLYSTGPHINMLKELDIRFIINAKAGNLASLFDWVKSCEMDSFEYTQNDIHHQFSFINDVPLNDTHFETKVNFLDYWETDKKGKKQHFSFITDIHLTKKNVELIMRGGRARWRIENETFNTLKNQGYNFEHNFGHGNKYLRSVLGMLMMLAFFVDQISELHNEPFQKARTKTGTYYNLWQRMRTFFECLIFKTWEELFEVIANPSNLTMVNSS